MKGLKRTLAAVLAAMCLMNAAPAGAESSAPVMPDGQGIKVPTQTAEPVIVEMKNGSRGEEVLRLQQRLKQLGFFYTAEDGIFGANTQAAVIEFENYVRLLEQDEIDRMIEAQKTPVPTETIAPTHTPGTTEAGPAASEEPGAALTPTASPAPTLTPTPVPTPATAADGIADVGLQALLYGEEDALYRRDAAQGDRGADVTRIQRRLVALNYLNDLPDGVFGVNTETAVKAFQHVHELEETGTADREMQKILYSEHAVVSVRPVYNQLYLWVTGDDVKTVQQQLKILGFMTGRASGTFDENTQAGVMQLEWYLHELELAEKGQASVQAGATPVPEELLDRQGMIEGDPETNPYEVIPENVPSAAQNDTVNTPQHTQSADHQTGELAAAASPAVSAAPTGMPAAPDAANQPSVMEEDRFTPTGVMSAAMQEKLLEEGIPVYRQTVEKGSSGDEVIRVQRRLYMLGYLTANGVDGIFGNGTKDAVSSFQGRNGLEKTGIADSAMQSALFSEEAVKAIKPYQIRISVKEQRVYVYTHDSNDEYTVEVKKFVCSTGTNDSPTPLGTFTNTGPGARWHYFKKFDCWAQYAYYIDGDIMFHSVLYDEQDTSTLRKGSVNALGKKASHGCVRLQVEDAKWIYNNCKAGTTVVVY